MRYNPGMDRLSAIAAFVRVAESRSFTAAGRTLGVSASAVGKSVAKLEAELGVRLLQRTTRSVRLTTEGSAYLEPCRRALDALAEGQDALSEMADSPRGRLRVSLPTIGYRFLLPRMSTFTRRHPEIWLDLDFSDRLVDVVEEGFDAVIRSGPPPDSRLVARRLSGFRWVLCAAPSYLLWAGRPQGLDDLAAHACLRFRPDSEAKPQRWHLRGLPDAIADGYPMTLVANNMEAIRTAAIAGLGLAMMPTFLAAEGLADGRLVALLSEATEPGGDFWLLWPSNRHLAPKLRVFIDHLVENLELTTTAA